MYSVEGVVRFFGLELLRREGPAVGSVDGNLDGPEDPLCGGGCVLRIVIDVVYFGMVGSWVDG